MMTMMTWWWCWLTDPLTRAITWSSVRQFTLHDCDSPLTLVHWLIFTRPTTQLERGSWNSLRQAPSLSSHQHTRSSQASEARSPKTYFLFLQFVYVRPWERDVAAWFGWLDCLVVAYSCAVHGCVLLLYTLSATRSLTHKSRLRVACVWSPPPASGTGYSSSAILYTKCAVWVI